MRIADQESASVLETTAVGPAVVAVCSVSLALALDSAGLEPQFSLRGLTGVERMYMRGFQLCQRQSSRRSLHHLQPDWGGRWFSLVDRRSSIYHADNSFEWLYVLPDN